MFSILKYRFMVNSLMHPRGSTSLCSSFSFFSPIFHACIYTNPFFFCILHIVFYWSDANLLISNFMVYVLSFSKRGYLHGILRACQVSCCRINKQAVLGTVWIINQHTMTQISWDLLDYSWMGPSHKERTNIEM